MTNDFLSGRIAYIHSGEEIGREWFEMVSHKGGATRTLRAFVEMDNIGLSRDVSLLLDSQSRPIDAFCRVTSHGNVKGSALFTADDDGLTCEGRIDGGRISQHMPAPGGIQYLGLHPLVGDALIAVSRGTDRPGEYVTITGFTNSYSPAGDTGLYAMPASIDVAYIGQEQQEVPAGRFETERYALCWHPDWPPADLWVNGPHAMFVKLSWSLIDAVYELTQLRTGR